MCRGPTRGPSVSAPKTPTNTITTMRPMFRAPRSRIFEGDEPSAGGQGTLHHLPKVALLGARRSGRVMKWAVVPGFRSAARERACLHSIRATQLTHFKPAA
jgi:hypothetical protein